MYNRYTEIDYNSITYLIEKFLGTAIKPESRHFFAVIPISDVFIQIRRIKILTRMEMNFPTRATQKVFAHVRLIYVVHKLASSETI